MVLDSMVDVHCSDIGVKVVSMSGLEQGKYPQAAGVRQSKLYGVSSCRTELVLTGVEIPIFVLLKAIAKDLVWIDLTVENYLYALMTWRNERPINSYSCRISTYPPKNAPPSKFGQKPPKPG
ncbi:hypothetical protein [Pseudomonas sp. ILQ215 TE3946]|uniref:hypothetical protein n=1 Tax=Pseudomonas sp. ILQ215 TE3946 TaxID=3349326 RepID=UPI003D225E47